jgi:hypothetical protein
MPRYQRVVSRPTRQWRIASPAKASRRESLAEAAGAAGSADRAWSTIQSLR